LWFAPEAVRGLLLVGESVSAEAWFALIRASALFNKEAAQAIIQLMPVVRLMGSSEATEWNTTKLSAWWEAVKDRKDTGRDAGMDAALLYSLFDALGEPVPADAWDKLVAGDKRRNVSMPDVALWLRLIEATEAVRKSSLKPGNASSKVALSRSTSGESNGAAPVSSDVSPATTPPAPKIRSRVAEMVMLALLALGEAGPAGADPLVLRQVLVGLRAAGFEDEARSMAVEAALAAGL
jgi:hypothetical protein